MNIYKANGAEKNPNYAPTLANLGLLLRDMKKKKEALKTLKEALQLLMQNNDPYYEFIKKEYEKLK